MIAWEEEGDTCDKVSKVRLRAWEMAMDLFPYTTITTKSTYDNGGSTPRSTRPMQGKYCQNYGGISKWVCTDTEPGLHLLIKL